MDLEPVDIVFLESLAKRLSDVLYDHSKVVYPKLQHDDYDRLNAIVLNAKIANWNKLHHKK